MSKRDEGAALGFYEEAGYLPAAVRNYLCLLGWSPGENQEILPVADLIQRFDLPNINRSNARFDGDKLFWMNGEYWRTLTDAEFQKFADEFLRRTRPKVAQMDPALLKRLLPLIREKVRTGREMAEWLDPYLSEEYEYSEEAKKKQLGAPEAGKWLEALSSSLGALGAGWDDSTIEGACKKVAEEAGAKPAKVIHLARAAVSGRTVGPSLFGLLTALGKERVLQRLERTRRQLAEGTLVAG
jgi:glutamyl-tRNA synthetase